MSIRTLLFLVILLLGGGSVVGQLLIQEFQREFDTQLKRSEKEHQELLQLVGHMPYRYPILPPSIKYWTQTA